MSKSVAKALRGGIGGDKKRGISTFLLALSGVTGAFATDLDKRRRRGPLHGRRPRRSPRSQAAPPAPRAPRRALCTRTGTFNRTSREQNAHLDDHRTDPSLTTPDGFRQHHPAPTPARRPRPLVSRAQ